MWRRTKSPRSKRVEGGPKDGLAVDVGEEVSLGVGASHGSLRKKRWKRTEPLKVPGSLLFLFWAAQDVELGAFVLSTPPDCLFYFKL